VFLGWLPHPELLLATSDVLVCSSRFESFGMALVEAMSCGLPVVSTSVGGPSEIVAEGETGYLVPPGRADRIAERVASLLDDPAARATMGARGRRRVEERFSLKRYASEVSDVIESLADLRRGEKPVA
jgi:glycosyltransferase involved in cell wall biosynthesis